MFIFAGGIRWYVTWNL